MDAVTESVANVVIKKIKDWYTYLKDYNDNITKFGNELRNLESLEKDVNEIIKRKTRNNEVVTNIAKTWLEDVKKKKEEFQKDFQELIDYEERKLDQCCYGGFPFNLGQRYFMSSNAANKASEVESIRKNKPDDAMLTQPKSSSDMERIPTEFTRTLSSRVELMKHILEKLQDDEVDSVGIYGMGGLGKTTLVKEIANVEGRCMFDEIVIADISEAPNVKRIQYQMAEKLDLTLQEHSQDERARALHERIMKSISHEKMRKSILIILDNVWGKLDVKGIGIPTVHENTNEFRCKLLYTSGKKDVCEAVGVNTSNIFEMHTLDESEARQLFKERVGEIYEDGEEELVHRLLKRCGGLPLAIVALADVLKGKELSFWEQYATELEKPSRSGTTVRDVLGHTYSILETSFKLLEPEEKKKFFFLACLFPVGSSIPVEVMMRYGIGLGLFQHVDNLTEAMKQANKWVLELISSSLLLKEEWVAHHVRIHDMVRESAIAMSQQGLNKIMVDDLPRWLWVETCQEYSAISLGDPLSHSRLDGLKSKKLQILILDGTQPSHEFRDTFFGGMTNLKVLVLKRMDFISGLPKSIGRLKRNLRVLCLENCRLGDIGDVIGELTNLLVLSFRGSRMIKDEFPAKGMRKLQKLCLLDLRECESRWKEIPAEVLSSLSQLEGLYAFDSLWNWPIDNNGVELRLPNEDEAESSINELSKLNYLNVLELQVPDFRLPVNENFVKNLEKFFILIHGKLKERFKTPNEFSKFVKKTTLRIDVPKFNCTLILESIDVSSTMEEYSCVKALLRKTERLYIKNATGMAQFADYHSHNGNLEGVKYLSIEGCYEIKHDLTWITCLNLEDLVVASLPNLEKMHLPHATFAKLRFLTLQDLPELQPYALPINASYPNLVNLELMNCPGLKFIFGKENWMDTGTSNSQSESITHYFPSLQYLRLDVIGLQSILGIPCTTTTATTDKEESTCLQGSPALFNAELILPALESVVLLSLGETVSLCDVPYASFQNLKTLSIWGGEKLESICTLSVATAALTQLESLIVLGCPNMRQLVKDSWEMQSEAETCTYPFPRLRSVFLLECSNLETFIATHQSNAIEFSSLESIQINSCAKLRCFSSTVTLAPKLSHIDVEGNRRNMKHEIIRDINQLLCHCKGS